MFHLFHELLNRMQATFAAKIRCRYCTIEAWHRQLSASECKVHPARRNIPAKSCLRPIHRYFELITETNCHYSCSLLALLPWRTKTTDSEVNFDCGWSLEQVEHSLFKSLKSFLRSRRFDLAKILFLCEFCLTF